MHALSVAVVTLLSGPGCLALWAVKSGDKEPTPSPTAAAAATSQPESQVPFWLQNTGTPYTIAEWDVSVDVRADQVVPLKNGARRWMTQGAGMLLFVENMGMVRIQAMAAAAGKADADARARAAGIEPPPNAVEPKPSDFSRDVLLESYRQDFVEAGLTPEAPQVAGTLLGHPAMSIFGYSAEKGAAGLTFVAVNADGTCGFSVVFTAPDRQRVTALAQQVIQKMKTISGGAAAPSICRQ